MNISTVYFILMYDLCSICVYFEVFVRYLCVFCIYVFDRLLWCSTVIYLHHTLNTLTNQVSILVKSFGQWSTQSKLEVWKFLSFFHWLRRFINAIMSNEHYNRKLYLNHTWWWHKVNTRSRALSIWQWFELIVELFKPERWLSDPRPHSFACLPYGFGSRSCVGEKFAQLQISTLLAEVIVNDLRI